MMPSRNKKPAPSMTLGKQQRKIRRLLPVIVQKAVERKDATFPSLSARRMKTAYFKPTISVSAQITSEMQPRTLSGVGAICAGP